MFEIIKPLILFGSFSVAWNQSLFCQPVVPPDKLCQNETDSQPCFFYNTQACNPKELGALSISLPANFNIDFKYVTGHFSMNFNNNQTYDGNTSFVVKIASALSSRSLCSSYRFKTFWVSRVTIECAISNPWEVIKISLGEEFQKELQYQFYVPIQVSVPESCTWTPLVTVLVYQTGFVLTTHLPLNGGKMWAVSLLQGRSIVLSQSITLDSKGSLKLSIHNLVQGTYTFNLEPYNNNTNCTYITSAPFSIGPVKDTVISISKIIGVVSLVVILVILFALTWILIKMFGKKSINTKPQVMLLYNPINDQYCQLMIKFADYLRVHCQIDVIIETFGTTVDIVQFVSRAPKELNAVLVAVTLGLNLDPEWADQEKVVLFYFEHNSPPPNPYPTKPILLLLDELPRLLSAIHGCQPLFSWLKVYPRMPGYDFLSNSEGYSLHHALTKLGAKSPRSSFSRPLAPEQIPLVQQSQEIQNDTSINT